MSEQRLTEQRNHDKEVSGAEQICNNYNFALQQAGTKDLNNSWGDSQSKIHEAKTIFGFYGVFVFM